MQLTPDLLRASYALLAETAPFNTWALPDADDVTFKVLKTHRWFGDCARLGRAEDGGWHIRLSSSRHKRLSGVLATMAHEMVHVHLRECGSHRDSQHHGPNFKAYAKLVCEQHPEFDPGVF